MDWPVTELNYSWHASKVVSDEFLWHGNVMPRECWLWGPVWDWIMDYRAMGHSIELSEWQVPTITPGHIAMRVEGVSIKFDDPSIAVLFKLTWGGK